MSYCPIKNGSCLSTCAWNDNWNCALITAIKGINKNLSEINSKLLEPNPHEIQKTRDLNNAMIVNNMEVQKRTAALLDECSSYIKNEKARAQLELERWDT